MSNKKLNYLTKILALTIVMLMLGTSIANAAFIDTSKFTSAFMSLNIGQKDDTTKESKEFLNEIYAYTKKMDKNASQEEIKTDLFDKVTELMGQYGDNEQVQSLGDTMKFEIATTSSTDTSSLLNILKKVIKTLAGMLGKSDSLTPDEESYIQATTAEKMTGDSQYNVKLHVNIYYAEVDENGKPTSTKWALLVHPNQYTGQKMANVVGQMYLDNGYNIIAPDLRGFGDSEGEVAMGYLESLDMWDCLTYINERYVTEKVIVHGISLGGATTIQLSGLEVDGKNLESQHVIGLVEDCGYTSMTEMIEKYLGDDSGLIGKILGILSGYGGSDAKETLINKNIGFTEENFEELENGLNSLERCTVPLLIIHGTSDSMVPFENSTKVYETATREGSKVPFVDRFVAEGEQHAFIILGKQKDTYASYVTNFISKAEGNTSIDNSATISGNNEGQQESSETGAFAKALTLIKNLFQK